MSKLKQGFVDYLSDAGYDIHRMNANDWNEDGYFEMAVDSQNRVVREVQNWRPWKNPEHYLWLLDNWLDRREGD